MSEDKKTKYRGFTPAQAKAHKRYMKDFVEIKVRMKADKRTIVQEHAADMGESTTAFINRAIDETIERDGNLPATDQQSASRGPVPQTVIQAMTTDKMAEVQQHAAGMGESIGAFINRAIDETINRDSIQKALDTTMSRSSISPEPTPQAAAPPSERQEKHHESFTKEDEQQIDLQELLVNIRYQREIIDKYGWDILDKLMDKARQQTSGEDGE